jgi:hypothetical protein
LAGDERLSPGARKAIEEREELYVSAASVWEIAIKASLGRLELPEDLESFLLEAMEAEALLPLPVTLAHAAMVRGLPWHHPFYANAFVLGHQWNRVCRLRVSGSWARTRHRSATTSIISSRS